MNVEPGEAINQIEAENLDRDKFTLHVIAKRHRIAIAAAEFACGRKDDEYVAALLGLAQRSGHQGLDIAGVDQAVEEGLGLGIGLARQRDHAVMHGEDSLYI